MNKIIVPNTVNNLEGIDFREDILSKTMRIDGLDRSFRYYIPDGLKSSPRVVILAHGSYCNGDIMRTATAYAFEEAARSENLIVVYPDSFGPYWNDGRLGRMHMARELEVDEEKFFKRIIHYLKEVYGADESQVYFGGFSNGGALGLMLAQRDVFRGMVLWCINLPSVENRNYEITGKTPILLMNNRDDRMVPFGGGDLLGADGKSRGRFDSTYESFMKISGIGELPLPEIGDQYKRYSAKGYILYELERGGHVIPHPATLWPAALGKGSSLDSISIALDFFRDISRRPPL